jgi:LacI family transcriptional regulator
VLTGTTRVEEETKQRVLAAIAATGYEPDQIAQSLVQQRSRTIALALLLGEGGFSLSGIGQSRFYFYLHILSEIERETAAAGYDLFLPSHPYSDFARYVSTLKTRRVDGMIMIAPYPFEERVRAMIKSNIPTLFVDAVGQGPRASYVMVDHIGGCRQAIQHLLALGHRRIAILTGEKDNDPASQRLLGYQLALAEAGVGMDEKLVLHAGFDRVEAYEAMVALLKAYCGEFTAIVAASDMMAIGALRALREQGIRVPEDVSVVGFDDIDLCPDIDPPLTTIRPDKEVLAQGAVRKLLDIIENNGPVAPSIASTQLVQRASTGPVLH